MMKIASREQPKNALGSLAWGDASKGVLSKDERSGIVEKFEFVMTQEKVDADRKRLGLLKPKYIPIESLTPPDSKIVKDALTYAEETHVAALLRHSWRTYYFGALIASHDGIAVDQTIGDQVILRGEATGTPTGEFWGAKASGKSFKTMALDIFTVKNGKLASCYHVENWMTALQQISK